MVDNKPPIKSLVELEIVGQWTGHGSYRVICRDCGDVTNIEGPVTEAPIQQAALYRNRHLARHLAALSAEITEAAR